jgi:hypothetical protein
MQSMEKTVQLDVREIARRVDERTGIKSLKRFCEETGIAEGSLRWMLFNEGKYGLERAGAVIRFHRRIFIDAERFLEHLRRTACKGTPG